MKILFSFLFLLFPLLMQAQDSLWTMEKAIVYAKANNLAVQNGVLSERLAKLQQDQAKAALLPNFSLGGSYGKSFGRSIDPTTNNFINNTYSYSGLSASSGLLVFGWFQKQYTVTKSKLQHKAAEYDLDQMENDIGLNVCNAYLKILLAREQIKVSLRQLEIGQTQNNRTQQLLAAGRSNGLDLSQVRTTQASDSAAYFKNLLLYQQAVLECKAILNLDWNTPFAVSPVEDSITIWSIASLDPDEVYRQAEGNLGKIRSVDLGIQIAKKEWQIANSALWPQISFSGSSGSNYSSSFTEPAPGGEYRTMPLGRQLNNNLSHSLSVGISIPIFNNLSARYNRTQRRIAVQTSILKSKEARQKLQLEVLERCNDIKTAYLSYYALLNAQKTAQEGQSFAQARYEKGLISAMDLIITQNTFFKASADVLLARYELIFKLKTIDYYKKVYPFD